jgi:WD40 repeat protein
VQGTLVFTNAGDCRIRVVDLVGGVERPIARFGGNCQLWVPPVSQRLAYGLGPASPDGFSPFRVADLGHPNRELGGYRALFGVVLWSQDGQRVAWCGRRRTGFDLEVGGAARRLPRCPIAYTPDGRIAYTIGNRLFVDNRTVLRINGGITFAHYGADGSLAVVEDGVQILRYDSGGRFTGAFPTVEGESPILSPDNCAAAFRPFGGLERITFIELGCFHGRAPRPIIGRDAAWSPDGRWLAIAQGDSITFQRLIGLAETIRWPASAVQLAWRVR